MPWEIAQYGVAALAVGGLIYLVATWIKQRGGNGELAAVIENNTKAMEQLISVTRAIQLSITKQEAKLDELLARSRKNN